MSATNLMLALCLTLLIILSACDGGPKQKTADISNDSFVEAASQKGERSAMRFKKRELFDRNGFNMPVGTLLIPSDWQFYSEVNWILARSGVPVDIYSKSYNLNTFEAFETFPTQCFYWTNSQMTQTNFPRGSFLYGHEVQPPTDVLSALKLIALTRFRSEYGDLRIVEEKVLSGLAESLGGQGQQTPMMQVFNEGGMVKLEYTLNGILVGEELYGVIEIASTTMSDMFQGSVTSSFWYLSYLYSFKAPKGKLIQEQKKFQTILHSFDLNLQWYNRYTQLVQQIIAQNIQNIKSLGELSRYIAKTNDEISQIIIDGYNSRQAVNDRIADNFSRTIRGVETLAEPGGSNVELPLGYDNAWISDGGEYIVSDDPLFNPNFNSEFNWERLKRTE